MDKTQGLQLRDIHMPMDPGYWPLAPGWWVIIVLAILMTYIVIKKINKIRRRKHTINMLQSQLQQLREEFNKHKSKHKLAIGISELLKRFVRHILKDSLATSLTGDNWIDYLNKKMGSDVFDEFNQELTQAQYSPNIEYDVSKLVATVKNFFPEAIKTLNTKSSIKSVNSQIGSEMDA